MSYLFFQICNELKYRFLYIHLKFNCTLHKATANINYLTFLCDVVGNINKLVNMHVLRNYVK